jgi:hypothetical protein
MCLDRLEWVWLGLDWFDRFDRFDRFEFVCMGLDDVWIMFR